MKILKALLVAFLCSILMVVMLFTVFDYTLRSTILSADFMKDRLSAESYGDSGDQSIYQLSADTVEDAALSAFEGQAEEAAGGEDWDTELFQETLEDVLEEAEIDVWLQVQIEDILEKVDEDTGDKDGIYPYIKSEADNIEIVINVEELKDDFQVSLRENLQDRFDELQAENNLPEGLAGIDEDIAWGRVEEAMEAMVSEVDIYVEDEIDLSQDQEDLEDMEAMRSTATLFNVLYPWLCIAAILLMLLIALLLLLPFKDIWGGVKAILRSLGIVFLLTGIICVILALVLGTLIPQSIPVDDLREGLTDEMSGSDADVETLTDLIADVINEDTVEDFFKHLFAPAKAAGIILIIIGVVMVVSWLVLYFVKKPSKEEEVPPEELLEEVGEAPSEGAPEGPTEEAFGDWTEQDEKLLAESLEEAPEAEAASEGEPAELTGEGAGEASAEPSESSDEDSLSELVDEPPEESS